MLESVRERIDCIRQVSCTFEQESGKAGRCVGSHVPIDDGATVGLRVRVDEVALLGKRAEHHPMFNQHMPDLANVATTVAVVGPRLGGSRGGEAPIRTTLCWRCKR